MFYLAHYWRRPLAFNHHQPLLELMLASLTIIRLLVHHLLLPTQLGHHLVLDCEDAVLALIGWVLYRIFFKFLNLLWYYRWLKWLDDRGKLRICSRSWLLPLFWRRTLAAGGTLFLLLHSLELACRQREQRKSFHDFTVENICFKSNLERFKAWLLLLYANFGSFF